MKNYDLNELNEFTSDKPVLFDPPIKTLVWDYAGHAEEKLVLAYLPGRAKPVVLADGSAYHCAEISEKAARRATNRELAKWLAQGNGEWRWRESNSCYTNSYYYFCTADDAKRSVSDDILVRKWDDDEWREPTVDYMFGEDAE